LDLEREVVVELQIEFAIVLDLRNGRSKQHVASDKGYISLFLVIRAIIKHF
jgi:hypothetical protein